MHRKAITNYGNLKASVIARGYTLRSWAMKKGHCVSSVYAAAKGDRSGIKSVRIRKQLEALINE